jgi:outer membrane protein
MEKNMKRTVLLLFGIYLSGGQLLAQAPTSRDTAKFTSLEELWAFALKSNSAKKVNALAVQKAITDYKTSQSYLYPSVSGGFTGQDNLKIAVTPIPGEIVNQPGKTIYAKFGKQYVYNTGLSVSRTFFDWQASFLSAAAKNNVALANAQADAYDQTLKQQTAQYYYTALVANAAVVLNQQDLVLADSLVQLAKQRFNEGLADISAVNLAAINYNNVKQSGIQTRQLLQQSLFSLHALTGLPADAPLQLTETIDITGTGYNNGQGVIGSDKNLEAYNWQVKGAAINTKLQKAAFVPKLGVSSFFGKQQYREDFGMSFSKGAWTDNQYIALNLSIPIFTGFSLKNKLRSAEISQKIISEQYKGALLQSAVNDSIVLSNVNQYKALCEASAANFNLYGANMQLSKQKYTEGLISLDVYLKSFEDYLKAENTQLNNLSLFYTENSVLLSRK